MNERAVQRFGQFFYFKEIIDFRIVDNFTSRLKRQPLEVTSVPSHVASTLVRFLQCLSGLDGRFSAFVHALKPKNDQNDQTMLKSDHKHLKSDQKQLSRDHNLLKSDH